MSYLAQLFERIGLDINRPFNDFTPFIKALEQNWYDNEQAIRQIKDEQFDSMKIPRRIVAKIRQFTSPVQQNSQAGMKQIPKQEWDQPSYKSQVIDFNKVLKEQICYEDVFVHFISSFQNQTTNNKTKMLESIKVLIKIVENILQNPDNQKFKTIKLTSKTLTNNLLCYDSCAQILEFIGFVKTVQDIVMLEPNIGHLKSCRRNLQIKLQSVQKMYDPYQASFNSSSLTPNMISLEGDKDDKDYKTMLDELIAYRKQKMSHPPKDRKVRIYHKKYDEKEYEVKSITLQQQFQTSGDPIIRQYYQKLSAQNSESSSFKNKRKMEFQLLIKQPIYQSTLIKIRLPNEYILQGIFGPHETINNLFQFVYKYIQGQVYIYTTPPVKHMSKYRDKTLVEMECVPLGIFYLGSDSAWQVRQEYHGFVQS